MAGDDATVSVEEVKKHASQDDCWIVVDDVVWDITDFAGEHPGGSDSMYFFSFNLYSPLLSNSSFSIPGFFFCTIRSTLHIFAVYVLLLNTKIPSIPHE